MKVEGYSDSLFATLNNKKIASFKIPTTIKSDISKKSWSSGCRL